MSRETRSGWTIATLKAFLEGEIAALRERLEERYATQTKATDAAFKAQQTAMTTAFNAADKAVQAALAAAKEASTKAEVAADKRFASVNEFRQQLSDQARTFMPRSEYEAAHGALTEKIETGLQQRVDENSRNADRINGLELRLTSRLDQGTGRDNGTRSSTEDARWNATFNQFERANKAQSTRAVLALVVSAASIIVAIVTVLVVVFHH